MIRFYFNLAPNPMKVALCLEEMGLSYEPVPVDTRKGEQHAPAFLAINPNGKVPVIIDGDAIVFDSNAILLYLGEKTGKFMPPATNAERGQLLSWLMFVASGIGPYSGQSVHFRNYAPEKFSWIWADRARVKANRYSNLSPRLVSFLSSPKRAFVFLNACRPNPHILFRFSLGPVYSADSTNSYIRWRFRLPNDTTGSSARTRTTTTGTPFL